MSLVVLGAVLAALFAALVAGCGDGGLPSSHVPVPTASCGQQQRLAKAPLPGESVYCAGPLTLAVGDYGSLATLSHRQLAHPLGSKAIAVVTDSRPVALAVAPGSRGRFSLQFTPERDPGSPVAQIRDGASAVRFPACAGGRHRFGGGILFAGPGCVHLRAQPAGRPPIPLVIAIGTSPPGCMTTRAIQQLSMPVLRFLRVSCRACAPLANAAAVRPRRSTGPVWR